MCNLAKLYPVLLLSLLLLCGLLGPAHAESLFEQYSRKSATDLNLETQEMGQQLKSYFSVENIAQKQQQIDFSEYRSNLKKALLYAVSLTTYSEYEKDLQFARDKEIFKGLPIELKTSSGDENLQRRKDFMGKKYLRMQKNVEEEIATYSDLLLLSLETCETLTRQDFSGIQEDSRFIEEMRDFLHGEDGQRFQTRQTEMARRWPLLSQRLAGQVALWQRPSIKPDAPIIDPQIIGALQ